MRDFPGTIDYVLIVATILSIISIVVCVFYS